MKFFTFSHLSDVGETYNQHLSWCLYSTYIYLIMIPIALIHGIFPFLLANLPDRIMHGYMQKFKARRALTGQAENLPD